MGNVLNISPKGAEFVFAGKKRKMLFINRAVKYVAEKHSGFQRAIRAMDDGDGDINYEILTDIVYAGFMVNKDDELTREIVADALDEMSFPETRELATTHLVAALTGSYPEAKGNPQG